MANEKQLNYTAEEVNLLLDKINNGEVLTSSEKLKLQSINLSNYATINYVNNVIGNIGIGGGSNITIEGSGDNWISVKDFGAKGDGVTDDTNAIRDAINSNHRFIKMDCDCYITDKIILAKHKRYKFEGSFIVNPNSFKGSAVIEINDVTDELDIDRISIFTKDFYMKNRHDVSASYSRTTFDGIVINECRRIHIGFVQVVGLSHRAFVFNGQYECIIGSMDLWASNLTDSQCIKSSKSDVIATPSGSTQNIPQDSRYTVGACFFKADCIIHNAVIVGFNIGMFIEEATIVSNYHPWAYIATMIYALVVDGCHNMCNNIYIDTIGNNEDKTIAFPTSLIPRKPAGIYEMKKADGRRDGYSIERNKYCNISAIKVRINAAIIEMGDNDSSNAGYMDMVSNMVPYALTAEGATIYRLHGNAAKNPNLQKPQEY